MRPKPGRSRLSSAVPSDHDAPPRGVTTGADSPTLKHADHLSGHHRETISQILQHPVSHNIEWRAVVSLLQAVAQVEETHNGKLLVTLGGETETFEPSNHKGINTQQVVDLRRMLRGAGFDDAEVTSSRAR